MASRPAWLLPVALVSSLLVAGCAGGEGEVDDDAGGAMPGASGPHGEHAAGEHLLAPTWSLGDWWTLQSAVGSFSHVVSDEAGGDWVVDTDSQDIAFFDAQDDISFLGKVRKSDLAGSQGDARVEFLRFPLTAGMEWTTSWDGEPVTVRAESVADGKADLLATRADGTTYARYSYSDQARYFTRFAFHDATGEEVAFEWSLAQSGTAFGSELARWTLAELYSTQGAIPTGTSANWQTPAGFTDVWMQVTLDCTAGAIVVAVGAATGPVEDRGYSAEGQCPLAETVGYPITAPAQAEQWGAIVTGLPGATTGTLDLTVLGRTLMTFPVGQAPA